MISNETISKLNDDELQALIDVAVKFRDERQAAVQIKDQENYERMIEKFRPEVNKIERWTEYSFEYLLPIKFKLMIGYDVDGSPYVEEFGAKLLNGNFDKKTKAELQKALDEYSYDVCERIFNIITPDQKKDLNKKVAKIRAITKELAKHGLDLTNFD